MSLIEMLSCFLLSFQMLWDFICIQVSPDITCQWSFDSNAKCTWLLECSFLYNLRWSSRPVAASAPSHMLLLVFQCKIEIHTNSVLVGTLLGDNGILPKDMTLVDSAIYSRIFHWCSVGLGSTVWWLWRPWHMIHIIFYILHFIYSHFM